MSVQKEIEKRLAPEESVPPGERDRYSYTSDASSRNSPSSSPSLSFDCTAHLSDLHLEPFGPLQKRLLGHSMFAIEAAFLRLQSGMLAVGLEVQPKQDIPIHLKLPAELTLFGMVRKGSFSAVLPDLGRQSFFARDWFVLRAGDLQIVLKEALSLVIFAADGPVLKKLLGLAAPGEVKALRCFVCPHLQEPSLVRHAGGERIHWLAERIHLYGGEGLDDRLALEARCLDLFREILRQPQLGDKQMCGSFCSEREEDILREIAAYLARHLALDHTLDGLSRRFNLNQFKLKCGFKRIFGVTVFQYLRKLRMQQAERLLKEGDCSVLEIANAVGYSNPSHFARNFKEQIGLLPKRYQLLQRPDRI